MKVFYHSDQLPFLLFGLKNESLSSRQIQLSERFLIWTWSRKDCLDWVYAATLTVLKSSWDLSMQPCSITFSGSLLNINLVKQNWTPFSTQQHSTQLSITAAMKLLHPHSSRCIRVGMRPKVFSSHCFSSSYSPFQILHSPLAKVHSSLHGNLSLKPLSFYHITVGVSHELSVPLLTSEILSLQQKPSGHSSSWAVKRCIKCAVCRALTSGFDPHGT